MTLRQAQGGLALRARGIGRDADDPRTLFVIFDREPTDAEVEAVHALLRAAPAAEGETAGPRPFAPLEAYEADRPAKDYAAEAAMKCAEPAFKRFLMECHGLQSPATDDRTAQKLRSLLGVTSRRELNESTAAAARWRSLRTAFDGWRRAR